MPTVVRAALAPDAAAIAALNTEVQALHAAALPWRFKPPGPSGFGAADAAVLIAHPDALVLLAERDAAPAGYAYAEIVRRPETPLHHAHDQVYLHHLSVGRAHRRQGVGSALIEAVHAAGKARGVDLLALDVWAFNDGARAFFRRHGFATYNERLWRR